MTVQITLPRAPAGDGGTGAAASPGPGAGRAKTALFFAACALFAGGVALAGGYLPQRTWGLFATGAYAAAAALALLPLRAARPAAVLVSLAGAVAAALAWLAAAGRGQPEVSVIIRSAGLLLHHGTPYLSPAAVSAAGNARLYDPYLPALTVFGVPRALGVPACWGTPGCGSAWSSPGCWWPRWPRWAGGARPAGPRWSSPPPWSHSRSWWAGTTCRRWR